MSLSRPLAEIPCGFCTQTFAHQSNLDHHLQFSTSCRLKRAVVGLKRRRDQGLPDPQPPHVQSRPLQATVDLDDDAIALEDNEEVNPEQQRNSAQSNFGEEDLIEDKIWDSTEQLVAWIKRAGLSQRQTDDMINLFSDQRMSIREALQIIKSHRDVDRYLMAQIIGENARMVDLARPGKDPHPILLTYKPFLEVVKKMAADAKAAGKDGSGFVLKPVIKRVVEVRRVDPSDPNSPMEEFEIRQYDHPSTGTWWNKAQDEIDADPAFQGDHIVLAIIIYLDKTTMDGLRRVSVFPMYISLANFSWEFYNARGGMELVALLPQPKADPGWPHPGYKPKSEAHRTLKRAFLTDSLSIITNDAREASYTGIDFKDPCGVARKGVPMIYCISKDLGEASTISNVMTNHCDSCMVPPTELHNLQGALAGEFGPRLEPAMRVAINRILDLKDNPRVSQKAEADERRKHGVHPRMPWFFRWKWGDQPWNAPYLKMVPDDLHTVFGGILGSHLFGLLDNIAEIHPLGKTAFLETMNVRLHKIYLYYNPGLRLPSSKEFFTSRYPTPNYEWKAVMQVLPILLAGLYTHGGRDVLVEWGVGLADWVSATFWTKNGVHDDGTLAESDRLLLVFDAKCDAIAGLQATCWNFRKYHDLSKFTRTIRALGAVRWTSTERGERKHHWVKIWWDDMNGRCIENALYEAWLRAIAVDTIEAQRAEVREIVRHRGKYDSAIVQADRAEENRLPLTSSFVVLWSNWLQTSPAKLVFDGDQQRRKFVELNQSQPLLVHLPSALGTYFAEHVGALEGRALDRVDPIRYLRDHDIDIRGGSESALVASVWRRGKWGSGAPQAADLRLTSETVSNQTCIGFHALKVHVVTSCYIVPHDGGHGKVHAARACPSYHGRPVYSDMAVQGTDVDEETGLAVKSIWYGRAILFFRAFEKVQEWDEDKQQLVRKSKPHELVFLRWYRVTGYTDPVHCRILEWEPCSRGQQASVQVLGIESLIGVEMMLPKTSGTYGKELWYHNKYLKL